VASSLWRLLGKGNGIFGDLFGNYRKSGCLRRTVFVSVVRQIEGQQMRFEPHLEKMIPRMLTLTLLCLQVTQPVLDFVCLLLPDAEAECALPGVSFGSDPSGERPLGISEEDSVAGLTVLSLCVSCFPNSIMNDRKIHRDMQGNEEVSLSEKNQEYEMDRAVPSGKDGTRQLALRSRTTIDRTLNRLRWEELTEARSVRLSL